MNDQGQSSAPSGLVDVVQVASGDFHTCALKSDKTVVCWGNNDWDQSIVPTNLTRVVEIAVGYSHSCALRETGRIVCW